MRSKNLDLILVMVIILINIAWTQIPTPHQFTIVGIILALPLILFLPGYALTQTLFRRRAPEQEEKPSRNRARSSALKIGHPAGKTDQLVLSIGLSMAIDILIGFTLNLLSIALGGLSWILSLSIFTLPFALLAIFLRRKDVPAAALTPRVHITLQNCVLFTLALLIVGSAVWLAIIRPLQPQPSFTQFWMLPANQATKACAVSLGVQNFETIPETYNVVISVNSTQTHTWSSIDLIPQQKWTQLAPIAPGIATSLHVEARLYRMDRPTVLYRNVHLSFFVSSININGSLQQQCVYGTQG